MKSYFWLLIGLAVGGVMGYGFKNKSREIKVDTGNTVKIAGVIDGDTIVTEDKTKIRLRQVDAPELGNCGAEEAKKLLEELTLGKNVQLEEQSFEQSVSHRPMYLVYVDDILVNEKLVESGWAKYHSDKSTATERLKGAKEKAENNKIGIFGERCTQTENKQDSKCNIKGNIDPDNSNKRTYQMPGCVQYKTTVVDLWRGEKWFCSEKEARDEGFVKSQRCPN